MRCNAVVAALLAVMTWVAPADAQPSRDREDDSSAMVDEGRTSLRQGNYSAAAAALDEAIRLNPRRLEAYVLRAAVHAARGESAAGIALMRRAQTIAPSDIDVMTALGAQLMLAGQPDEGVPLLERVVARDASRYDAHLLLAEHANRTQAWPSAITNYHGYLATRPDSLVGSDAARLVDLGNAYLRNRQPVQALSWFEKSLALAPTDERTRIARAWALAAIDCRRARPALAELAEVAERVPDIWLVDGRCALAMGAAGEARALADRVLAKKPRADAYALAGEAEAQRGNLQAAREAFAQASRLAPDSRRYRVRLATLLRRAGSASEAVRELDALGVPAGISKKSDLAWWYELGESLLASGQAVDTRRRLLPIAGELPLDVHVQVMLGEASLALGEFARATTEFEPLVTAQSPSEFDARAKAGFVTALHQAASLDLRAAEAAAAAEKLRRAAELGGADVWRDLGLALLMLNQPTEAVTWLSRSAATARTTSTLILLARAQQGSGAGANAEQSLRAALEQAGSDEVLSIARELAALELELAHADRAVEVLTSAKVTAVAKAATPDERTSIATALVTARHTQGLAKLRAGDAGAAERILATAVAEAGRSASAGLQCDLALATIAVGDHEQADRRLRGLAGVSCGFAGDDDARTLALLGALARGLRPGGAKRALSQLASIDRAAKGVTKTVAAAAIRVVALTGAEQASRAGRFSEARSMVDKAAKARTRVAADELALASAAMDAEGGRTSTAITVLERLSASLPMALIHLGIAQDRDGDGLAALRSWRRARDAGVEYPPLAEWIAAKERVFGATP